MIAAWRNSSKIENVRINSLLTIQASKFSGGTVVIVIGAPLQSRATVTRPLRNHAGVILNLVDGHVA